MPKSVCIIGAGPSGLVAAKTLLRNAPAGEFKVTVCDAQEAIGGLWPVSMADDKRQVHPLMLLNQSKHTVQFSDLAWDDDVPQFPQAWMVGEYLQRYVKRHLAGDAGLELKLRSKVVRAAPSAGPADGVGWDVVIQSDKGEDQRHFDHLLVASGFFGKPIIPEALRGPSDVPVIHSSQYRDLKGLIGKGNPSSGKILVVGGQMSGIEIAGTIASHLSAAANSADASDIIGIENFSVHHVIQRPIWVFPLFTSPEPAKKAAPFLPLDLGSYNLNNRPNQLFNTQGHITEDTARAVHSIFEAVVGTDQSPFGEHLRVKDVDKAAQPYLAVSDWYCDFVREGLISVSKGKVEGLHGTNATVSPGGSVVGNIAAVVVATGFDASPCLDFLPGDILEKLHHSPKHIDQPIALAFHGTHHPDVPNLGFVGFYRSPYWGVMQMQARFLSRFWSDTADRTQIKAKLGEDISVTRTLGLRDDPRVSQFPMGDYPYLMQELSEALGLAIQDPLTEGMPNLSHNNQPLNVLTPARYIDPAESGSAKLEAKRSLGSTHRVAVDGLTKARFVPRAVFRSLLGTWTLERDLKSRLPTHPSGHFSGTAKFLLRDLSKDGLQCASSGVEQPPTDDENWGMEYLYIEDGEFKTESGFGFRATRRYVWRYDERKEVLSVWFTKPEDAKRADYLFHEIEFMQPKEGEEEKGWPARAGHLCIDDYYDVTYNFAFRAVNLDKWGIEYSVRGPKKDYTIKGKYSR